MNPGYVGLSINHAFAFGTPVVTFKRGENGPFHSPEVEYIVNYETGYLAKSFDLDDMVAFIYEYFRNEEKQRFMKEQIINMMANTFTIENMVKGITDAINFVQ